MSAEISQHIEKAPTKYGIGWQRVLAELDGLPPVGRPTAAWGGLFWAFG
jgi:hypothetical protein